jgi:kynurenine formamidase
MATTRQISQKEPSMFTSPPAPVDTGHAPRWTRRPEGSTWGDFGPDDQLGRLNLLTPEKVRQGIAEVRDGESFCLSLPLDYPGGTALNENRFPPILRPTLRQGLAALNYPAPGRSDIISDDLAILHLQYSTQWDSLAHVGSLFDADGDGIPEPVYYNGYRAGTDILAPDDTTDGESSATALGVENMAAKAIQGRAVMIDLFAHFGDSRTLIGHDELQHVLTTDGVVIEPGDIVCLHTGFARAVLEMGGRPSHDALASAGSVLDGRDPRLLQWITDSGLAALAADNYAVEAFPATPVDGIASGLPLHEHCLFKLGVNLGELWWLTPIAMRLREQGRSRFFLTAPPLRLTGAVGSPVTPVGTL